MTAIAFAAPAHRTPPAIRRVLLAAAGLLALALVALGAYNLLDLASRHTTTQQASYMGVRSLVIEGAGDVRLTSGPAGAPVQVISHVTEGLRGPHRSAQRSAEGTLTLSSSCPGFLGGQCGVSYEVRVPSGTSVRADTDAGDLVAEALVSAQPVVLSSSAGDVTVSDVSAPSIELSSSAGDVEASGLRARQVELGSSAGDVIAALATPAERLVAESSAGDVELLVPNALYRLDASSSGGDVSAGRLRTDPAAARAITAHSSAGDVRVTPAR